jgi:hypothetical protein
MDGMTERLTGLVADGSMPAECLPAVVAAITDEFGSWRSGVVDELRRMVRDWEATMGPEDQTFYSLGIRRSIDVVTGAVATDPVGPS